MDLKWIHESPPHWDADKAAIVGGAPSGVFALGPFEDGQLLPGEWWRVEEHGSIVGYGWMDCTWGDAEVLLAVHPAAQHRGVGSFIIEQLQREATVRGVNYMHNVVRSTHPDREATARWLTQRGFAPSHDSERLQLRIGVRPV